MTSGHNTGLKSVLRILISASFVFTGMMHLLRPGLFLRIVPPRLPAPGALVFISGIFEIAGGIGLLIRPLQRAAGWGLISLLIAVFPANIYMAVAPQRFADLHLPPLLWWLRLPLQFLFIAGVWHVSRSPAAKSN